MTPAKEEIYLFRFQKNYFNLFRDTLKINRFDFNYNTFWIKTIYNQHRMARRREKHDDEGIQVPPVMIFSITNQCNLHCKGCYANAQNRKNGKEISTARMAQIIDEASELGIGIVIIAGGEPMMREEILDMSASHKEIIFPFFTNGLLLDEQKLNFLHQHKNLIPVLSLEGNREQTDSRRGKGIHAIIDTKMKAMQIRNQFFGLSITLTSKNFDQVMHPVMMRDYHKKGCGLFFLVEYVPTAKTDIELCLTDNQKKILQERLAQLRKEIPALFISLPGDEKQYGGCLAAGRGFIHISADGRLEPCPFAPYSDADLNYMSLKEALKSRFLEKIRQSHHQLSEAKGGCTLWENKEWVEKQLAKSIAASA